MSRIAALSVLAVCALGVVAQAASITHTVTLTGSYTLGLGSGPLVDVYTVRFDAGPGHVVGSIVVQIGLLVGDGGYDPVQSGWVSPGKSGNVMNLTPTAEDAAAWLTPPDSSKCYETDSHFLPAGIGTWEVTIWSPTESNDASIYSAGVNDYFCGKGSMYVATAPVGADRVQALDVVQVGVVHGEYVWFYDYSSANELGETTYEKFLIPEPATAGMLALGAMALRRRRKG